MKGKMLTYPAAGDVSEIELLTMPTLKQLQKAVGGFIEAVPRFDTIEYKGEKVPCIAFCDEEGKLKRKDINSKATQLWAEALGMTTRELFNNDVLVGDIVVLIGDEEFMGLL